MISLVSNMNGAAGFPAAVTKIGLGLKPVLPFFEEDGNAHLRKVRRGNFEGGAIPKFCVSLTAACS